MTATPMLTPMTAHAPTTVGSLAGLEQLLLAGGEPVVSRHTIQRTRFERATQRIQSLLAAQQVPSDGLTAVGLTHQGLWDGAMMLFLTPSAGRPLLELENWLGEIASMLRPNGLAEVMFCASGTRIALASLYRHHAPGAVPVVFHRPGAFYNAESA